MPRWTVGFMALALLATPLFSQTSHYGTWPVKDPQTRKIGVEALSISGEGVRGEPGYVATTEVFGPEEKYLATCELEWHQTKIVTCRFEDGEILRVSAAGKAGATFEDLRTGERVSAQVLMPEGLDETPTSTFAGDKTIEEVTREWGSKLEVISAVTTEVITFLFGSEGLLMSFPKERVSWPPEAPDGAIACPGAHEPVCASLPIFVSDTSFTGPRPCCTEITETLDVTCRFYTVGRSCC